MLPLLSCLGLEGLTAQRMHMTCPKLPGGGLSTNPVEMRSHAKEFSTDFFTAGSCNLECQKELLGGLRLLRLEEEAVLDSELTLEDCPPK